MYKIELLNITKDFNGFLANDNITLKVKNGTIHALIGENGAGKSTLMSILFGIYNPTFGKIMIDGNPLSIKNPSEASSIGIGMVHQHFKLVDVYTNFENIILGAEFENGILLDKKTARAKLESIQKAFKLEFDLDQITAQSSVAVQQKVEIMKMLYRDAEILIFDEPTAVLTPQEIEELLNIMLFLKEKGKTIIFISHKLKEVKKVSDEATVIRHGKLIKHYETLKDVNISSLATDMVGKNIVEAKNTTTIPENSKTVVRFLDVSFKKLQHFNLELKSGEIHSIAGVEGNGQEEIEYLLTGIEKPYSGKIFINNRVNNWISPKFSKLYSKKEKDKSNLTAKFEKNKNKILKKEAIECKKLENIIFKIFNIKSTEEQKQKLAISKSLELHNLEKTLNKYKTNREKNKSTKINALIEKFKIQKQKVIKLISNNEILFDEWKKELSFQKDLLNNIFEKKKVEMNDSYFESKKEYIKEVTAKKSNEEKQYTIFSEEKDITDFSSNQKRKEFISYIPGDRHKYAVLLDFNVEDNAIIRRLDDLWISKMGIVNEKSKEIFSKEIINDFDIRGSNDGQAIMSDLSGGNQQKLVVGREMKTKHDVLVVVQPTRGLDIGAINFIHQELIKQKELGKAILLISYELDEVIALADRISVINNGAIVGSGLSKELSRNKIGQLMAGIKE